MPYDRLIHNCRVMTVDAAFTVIERGYVAITGSRIAAVGNAETEPLPDAAARIDGGGGILMPGLVNTHTHLPMTLFRGMAEDLPLETWLTRHMFPAEAAHITPETAEAGARLGCAELLLSGTTTCCDGYFLEGAVAAAAAASGIRAVLGHGVIDHPAPGCPDPQKNVATAAAFCADWQAVSPRIRPSIFCHSPYTCSADTLIRAKQTARELGVRFQIHVAETQEEVNAHIARHTMTPAAWLDQLGILDEQTLVVHGVWLSDADIALLAERGCGISHNPESNLKLGAGIAPVPAMQAAGLCVGLGTDGAASNNDLDLFGEMRTAALVQKAAQGDPTTLNAETVVRMATIDGARVLGMAAEIGSIEVGKAADLVLLDSCSPRLTPVYHAASHAVYAAGGADVRDVFLDGEPVVINRRLITLDTETVMADVRAIAQRIHEGRRG